MHVDISKEAVTRPFEVRSFATRVFTFDELRDGTNNFELKSVLGEGGFGRVYQGVLKDGTPVAIKKLAAMNSWLKLKCSVDSIIVTL